MAFDNLRLFRDVALTRSLSRAAEMNGVTPSAASQQVNELERSLRARLLDRSTRPLSLTAEGRLYQDFCRDVLRRYDEFHGALDQLRSEIEGTVRVASIYSVGLSELSQLEDEFRRRVPQVRLDIEYLRPEKVYEAVLEDRADLGLVSYPEANRELSVILWREEEMVLATAPSHPLASSRRVAPSQLAGFDFISFDDDLPIAREIARYLRANDVAVNAALHFDNIQTIKEAVMHGSGISLVPRCILVSEVEAGRICAVPLAEPGLFRPLGIIHRKRKQFHRAAQSFLELLQEELEPSHA